MRNADGGQPQGPLSLLPVGFWSTLAHVCSHYADAVIYVGLNLNAASFPHVQAAEGAVRENIGSLMGNTETEQKGAL